MTKAELEQSIYARTRRFVDDDVMDAILDLLAASRRAALEEAIAGIEAYQVPVGNSAAGEMASEWTMDALKEVRDSIRALSKTAGGKDDNL